jgi:hypothetical protein
MRGALLLLLSIGSLPFPPLKKKKRIPVPEPALEAVGSGDEPLV